MYSGLRPGELRELRWREVRERTLLVDAANTGRRRTVRLLVAPAADWRCGGTRSFASLLFHEGRDVIYVARQLGHGAELALRTYGHVIEELEDSPQLRAEEAIRRAREVHATGAMYPSCTSDPDAFHGAGAGSGLPIERPEQDSNLRPTP